MGWYLHEEYSSFVKLPKKYDQAVCATCWTNETYKLAAEDLSREPRIFDIVHRIRRHGAQVDGESKHFITQEEFNTNHVGHVLSYVKVNGKWHEWKPMVFCKKCSEWTEILPKCPHGRISDDRPWDPCTTCYRPTSRGARCDCAETEPSKKQYLLADKNDTLTDDVRIYCYECQAFLKKKEIQKALDFGALDCFAADDCVARDYVHIFHFAKHHKDSRDRINIGYERGTKVSLIRAEYGKKLMRLGDKKRQKVSDDNEQVSDDEKVDD